MKWSMAIYGLVIFGTPAFLVFDIPHYALLLSAVCLILTIKSLVTMVKNRDDQFGNVFLFALGTVIMLLIGLTPFFPLIPLFIFGF